MAAAMPGRSIAAIGEAWRVSQSHGKVLQTPQRHRLVRMFCPVVVAILPEWWWQAERRQAQIDVAHAALIEPAGEIDGGIKG